jgi:hypothetical protein
MNRRTLLSGGITAALCGFSGCLGVLSETAPTQNASETDHNSSVDSNQAAEDFWLPRDDLPRFRDQTVVEFETAPLTATVADRWFRSADGFAVGMDLRSGATADSPARIAATVVNTQPYAQPLELPRLGLLDSPSYVQTSDRETMYVAPTESHPLAETIPEYERDTDGRWRVTDLRDDWYPQTVTVPGETGFVADYYLLGTHLMDEPPIVPGRYRSLGTDQFTIVTWSTTEPGPDETAALADRDVPPLPGEQSTSWYHESTPQTERFLQPDREQVEPPERISFEHINHSRQSLDGNPYYWRLYKLADGDWLPVAPWLWEQPAARLGPGGRSETKLAVFHGKSPSSTDGRTVDYLGGGLYAYTGGFDTETERFAALFELDGPELDVSIESTAEIIETGPTTVVELPNHAEARRPATFTVTKCDREDVDRTIIPEQLPRRPFRGLQNSLPVFDESVDSVRVKTDRGTALRLAGYEENEQRVIRYRGTTYCTVGTLDE